MGFGIEVALLPTPLQHLILCALSSYADLHMSQLARQKPDAVIEISLVCK